MKKDKKLKFNISNCEKDFIQFMFCENRILLGYKYKNLYKAMFEAYQDVWKKGRDYGVDLGMINKTFIANL
jgi:exo-beta-1,3-glucanase (GH17 family)